MSPTNYFSDPDQPVGHDGAKQWTLADVYNDMATREEVCEALNITTYRMARWLQRKEKTKPPLPIRTFASTHVYSIQEWRDWFANYLETQPRARAVNHKTKPYGAGKPFWEHFEKTND